MNKPAHQTQTAPGIRRERLDMLLVARGLAATRSRASDMIARGCVQVNGTVEQKAGSRTAVDASILVADPAQPYVSRAVLKLIAGLKCSQYDPNGAIALDLGASTGGFTQVLLERGALQVTALDVGHGQMVASLANDSRVALIEGVNARNLTLDMLSAAPNFIVCDVSFISLMLAAEPALKLAAPGCRAILLVKPQFEVGRTAIGKGGIVADPTAIEEAIAGVQAWFNALPGWLVEAFEPSPVKGSDGNREFLLCGSKT